MAPSEYKMTKGTEKVGPSMDDLKWCGFSLAIAVLVFKLSICIPSDNDFGSRMMFKIFLRNFMLFSTLFSAFHSYFYEGTNKKQLVKNGHKFNSKFPSKEYHETCRRNTALALIINSLFEIYVWKFQSFAMVTNLKGELWFIAWLILLPFWREIHYFVLHKVMHTQMFYAAFHSQNHQSSNPGPWNGLNLHPFECILYFSGSLLPYFLNLHPVHYLFYNIHCQMVAIKENLGYDLYGGSYFHYLHCAQKGSVNFGSTFLPLDILFGSWCNGKKK